MDNKTRNVKKFPLTLSKKDRMAISKNAGIHFIDGKLNVESRKDIPWNGNPLIEMYLMDAFMEIEGIQNADVREEWQDDGWAMWQKNIPMTFQFYEKDVEGLRELWLASGKQFPGFSTNLQLKFLNLFASI